MSKVYFIDFKASVKCNILEKLVKLFVTAGFNDLLVPGELVACKLHFGEYGNTNFINPVFVKKLVETIKKSKAIPFLTDTGTLYAGRRMLAPTHIEQALWDGFGGAPIIIADGLRGESYVSVKSEGAHFKDLKIASGIYYADKMIVISHFKGHFGTGFGGALKNLGMGCAAKQGKLEQHSGKPPVVNKKCTGCGLCIKWCPTQAITAIAGCSIELDGMAKIIPQKCIMCTSCISVCPSRAIDIDWGEATSRLQEAMAEYAKGAVYGKKGVGYINFLINIAPFCDCWPATEAFVTPDIGILASFDPVSIDRASYDMVEKASNGKFGKLWHQIKPEIQLDYAEKIGLGTQKYEIVEVE
ncbi:MAG: DUF362 domain-containing protein [bacterium]